MVNTGQTSLSGERTRVMDPIPTIGRLAPRFATRRRNHGPGGESDVSLIGLVLTIWLLQAFGLLGSLQNIRIR
jgi:hypothetical protein